MAKRGPRLMMGQKIMTNETCGDRCTRRVGRIRQCNGGRRAEMLCYVFGVEKCCKEFEYIYTVHYKN
jgi:hypothetical protein